MNAGPEYYFEQLYPLQDEALRVIGECDTEFYLTGGTAVSRGYLNHRFSDDLDLFVNYATARDTDPRYRMWCDEIIAGLGKYDGWTVRVGMRQPYFSRVFVTRANVELKIELVNDVPYRVGEPAIHPLLGRIDTPENILSNKITALRDRDVPRDLADVWGLVKAFNLSIEAAITGASSKAAGTYHAALARRFCTATQDDWAAIRWIEPPAVETYLAELMAIGEALLLP